MKGNNSPGEEGILQKLLMETVEQVRISLANVSYLLNGKKQISYHYFKRVREIIQIITEQ